MASPSESAEWPRGKCVMLKKSRSGCRECRRRKVKCDESRPVCSNCCRRYVGILRCEWPDAGFAHDRKTRKASSRKSARATQIWAKPSTNSCSPLSCQLALKPRTIHDVGMQRSLELRLLYHYTTVVGTSMPDCEGESSMRMWQCRIPQLAFGSEIVLNPLLAISALYLHCHSPNDVAMAAAVREYLDKALKAHRTALESRHRVLTEDLWVSAVVLANLHWLLARQAHEGEKYELPLQMWRALAGVGALFTRERDYLDNLGYGWYGEKLRRYIAPTTTLPIRSRTQLQDIELDLDCLLAAFDTDDCPSFESKIYLEAKSYVLYHYRAFYSGTAARTLRWHVGTMTIQCGEEFQKRLEDLDVLAMALLARMLVLLCGMEQTWWMNGMGEYKVLERDIPGMRELMPEDLRWTMDWPCRVLQGDIILDRS